jgi:hypothetical protein
MNTTVTQIAQEIIDELEDPSLILPNVVSWLRANIGILNMKIDESYTINSTTLEFDPEISIDAKSIFKQIYYCRYYKTKATSVLNNIGSSEILSLKDDSSSVSFVNRNEVSKNWKTMSDSECAKVDKLSSEYKKNRSIPKSFGSNCC